MVWTLGISLACMAVLGWTGILSYNKQYSSLYPLESWAIQDAIGYAIGLLLFLLLAFVIIGMLFFAFMKELVGV